MIDFKKNIQEAHKEFSELAHGELPASKIEGIDRYVKEKLSSVKPVVSLYGRYNAGKSTLLNALVGEEIAESGSAPTTSKIDEYQWGEWKIYDTPGIDAPIEHEQETEQHIRASECLLFVLSSQGSFEEDYIYTKIVELVKRNKPLLIILNDKTDMLNSSEELATIYTAIYTNLEKYWKKHNLEEKEYPKPLIYAINAMSALKAKNEGKKMLLENSNIQLVEEKIESFIRNIGKEDVINALIDYYRNHLNELREIIEKKLDNEALQNIEAQTKKITDDKHQAKYDAEIFMRKISADMHKDFMNISKETATQELHEIQEKIQNQMQNYLKGEYERIKDEYNNDVMPPLMTALMSEIEKVDVNAEQLKSPDALAINTEKLLELIPDEHKRNFIEKNIKKIIEKLSKVKILGKLPWEKISKFSSKALNPIVTILIAGVEMSRAHKKQQEYENECIESEQAFHSAINQTEESIKFQIRINTNNVLDDLFNHITQEINKIKIIYNEENTIIRDKLERIDDLSKKLEALTEVSKYQEE